MARFYVGQKVRIKYSNGWPEISGETGTILSTCPNRGIDGDSEWIVFVDVWGSELAPRRSNRGAVRFAPNSQQLDPATDSYEKSSWDDCAWKPEHLREVS